MTVLWNDYVAICIKIYNFKGSKKYDRFYVIDFNFVKVYRNGPSLHLKKSITWSKALGFRYDNLYVLVKWAFFPSLKANNLVK